MLSKSFAASIFLLALTSSVNAQVAFKPVLGGPATPVAADVQHPASGTPCGDASVPKYIDSSSCVQADSSGGFTVPFTNFGSAAPTISKMQVNVDGTGVSFVSGQAPTVDGTQLTAQLPSGIKCEGGSSGDRCVVSIVAADGTGNCIVVQQPKGTEVSHPPAASPTPTPTPTPKLQGAVAPAASSSPNKDTQSSVKSNDGSTYNGNKSNTGKGNSSESNKVNQRSNEGRMHSRDFMRKHVQ